MKQLHIIISGRVQGVGFRYFVQMNASQYGIKGTVRNLDDGSVEVIAVADQEKLSPFLEELKKGNLFAKVTDMDISPNNHVGEFRSFKIIY